MHSQANVENDHDGAGVLSMMTSSAIKARYGIHTSWECIATSLDCSVAWDNPSRLLDKLADASEETLEEDDPEYDSGLEDHYQSLKRCVEESIWHCEVPEGYVYLVFASKERTGHTVVLATQAEVKG